ncbi:MAG: ABC transporter substrate-binding protein [Phascolarctobacterium sp.]|nr:ABC transporter substrate-binding protein [Phascolarctobacterium sp.]
MRTIIFFILVLFLSGCSIANNYDALDRKKYDDRTNDACFTVRNYGSDLKEHDYIYRKHPGKILALWQNSIETLIALGVEDKIIACGGLGNENYLKKEHRQAYQSIKVKSRQVFSQEQVLLMQPEFILGWFFDFSGKGRSIGTTDFWEKRGTNIYMNLMNGAEFKSVHTLDDEIKYIRDVGKIVAKEEKAQAIISSMERKINDTKAKLKNKKPLRVLIVSSFMKNISIYTPRTLPGNIVTMLGAETLGKEFERVGEDEFISYEEILMMNPDVIFFSSAPERDKLILQRLQNHPVMRKLRCVKNNNYYTIPFYTIRSPGVRVVDAVDIFADGISKAVKNYQ